MRVFALLFALAVSVGITSTTFAEDQITRRGSSEPLRGEITKITRVAVTLKPPLNRPDETIPANEITRVRWDGEPAKLNLARNAEDAGRLDEALEGYRAIADDASISDLNLKADLDFLIARTLAKLALNNPEGAPEAASALNSFRRGHRDHFHDFEAADYLGRLALAAKDYAAAEAAFAELAGAPWPATQVAGKIAQSRVLLAKGDVDPALAAVNGVLEGASADPALVTQRYDALLQKAAILEQKQQPDEAAAALDEVVKLLPPDETRLQAEAYLQLGALRQGQGRQKEAVLAYLHVDVLFTGETAAHAEALYHLAHLWENVGHPDRAADAAARLRETYPKSEWAAKLGS